MPETVVETPPAEPAPAAAAPPRAVPVAVMELPGVGPSTPAESAGAQVSRVWIWQETGDCLWKMARDHYGDPFQWPRIYEANRDRIKDPHVIFPKQVLVIPPAEPRDE